MHEPYPPNRSQYLVQQSTGLLCVYPHPDVTLVISEVKGYGLHKCPIKEEPPLEEQPQTEVTTTEQLIDHAKALIDTAKTFITKLVNRKPGSKGSPTSSVASVSRSKQKIKALNVLQEQTVNNLTTLQVGTDGSVKPSKVDPPFPK